MYGRRDRLHLRFASRPMTRDHHSPIFDAQAIAVAFKEEKTYQ